MWHAGHSQQLEDGEAQLGPVSASLGQAWTVAVHACDASLDGVGIDHVGDPTEVGVLLPADAAEIDTRAVRVTAPRRAELPFDPDTKLMAAAVNHGNEGVLITVEGAPDVLEQRARWSTRPCQTVE